MDPTDVAHYTQFMAPSQLTLPVVQTSRGRCGLSLVQDKLAASL